LIHGPLGARHDAVLVLVREEVAKSAALCFDSVIPLGTDRVPKEVLAWGAPSAWQLNVSRFNAMLRTKTGAGKYAKVRVRLANSATYVIGADDPEDDAGVHATLLETLYVQNGRRFQEQVVQGLSEAAFLDTPLMLPASIDAKDSVLTNAAVSIKLSGINLVDVDRLSWEDIIHVRDDPLAMNGLRAIRDLFMSTRKSDKLDAEEGLSRALDDYTAAARSLGMPTIESDFGVVVAVKDGVANLQSNLPSLVFGHAATGIRLSRDGSIKTIAGVELGMFPVPSDFELLTRSHPLVFITSVRHVADVEAREY